MQKRRKKRAVKQARAKRKALPTVPQMMEKVQQLKRRPTLPDADYKMLCGVEGSLRKLRTKE